MGGASGGAAAAERAGPVAELVAAIAFYLAGCAVRARALVRAAALQRRAAAAGDAYGLLAVGNSRQQRPARPRRRRAARRVDHAARADRRAHGDRHDRRRARARRRRLVGLFVVLAYGVLGGVDVPSGGRCCSRRCRRGAARRRRRRGAVLHRRGHLGRVLAFLAPMAEATRRLRSNHGLRLLGITFVVWALEWVAWWLMARAAGLDLALLEVGYLMGLASVFALVPSGPGYVGTFDAAIAFGVRAVGRTGAQALSYLLLLRFVVTVPITLIGLVVLVAGYGGVGRVRAFVRA